MALVLADRVQQTGVANTTVSFTLSGTVTGFQSFAVVGNTNTTYYSATDASGNWEVGIGTYSTTGPTLTRTTILSSSNSGSAVTFSGTVAVILTYPSSKSVNQDASGNVGIGTTSPAKKLSVVNTTTTTTVGNNSVMTVQGGAGATVNSVAEIGFAFESFSGTNPLSAIGYQLISNAGSGSGALTFSTRSVTTDTAPSERMRIDSAGNVGIGTSSPVYKLDVVNNSNADLISHIYNANAGSSARSALVFGNDISTTVSGLFQNSSTATALGGAGSLNLFIGTSNPLTFSTNATERMRIDSAGNVGIANTAPVSKLQVTGASGITAFTGTTRLGLTVSGASTVTDYSGIDFLGNGNTSNPLSRIATIATSSGTLLQFGTSNSYASGITNTAMTIDYNGALLVGTTAVLGGEKGNFTQTSTGAVLRVINTNGSFADTALAISSTRAASTAFNLINASANGVNQFTVRGDGAVFASALTTSRNLNFSIGGTGGYIDSADGSWGLVYRPSVVGTNALHLWTNTSGGGLMDLNGSGRLQANQFNGISDVRAPIFYDSNDTAYYCNPNSTSNFYHIKIQAPGIAFDGYAAYAGVGANQIGFGWSSPNVSVGVDNAISGNFVSLSDRRLKTDIINFGEATDLLNKIRVVEYTPLDFDGTSTEKRCTGVIADELIDIIPEAVVGETNGISKDGKPRYQSVTYSALTPFLTKGFQEHDLIIKTQQAQIEAMQAQIDALIEKVGL